MFSKFTFFFWTYLFDFMHFLQHPLHIFICVIHIVYVSVTHFDVSSTNVVFYLSFDSSNVPLYSVYRFAIWIVSSIQNFHSQLTKQRSQRSYLADRVYWLSLNLFLFFVCLTDSVIKSSHCISKFCLNLNLPTWWVGS